MSEPAIQHSLSMSDGREADFQIGPIGDWAFNFLIAGSILLFLLPVMVIIGIAVWFQDGGPIFFQHRRIGLHGRTFGCLKFRTMRMDSDAALKALLARDEAARKEWAATQKLRADPRVTWIGKLLRQSSLDELPQLINVLRGEMNIVGPRPIIESEIPRYDRYYRHYCSVKPGITGLWQVSGRSNTSYRQRVMLDVKYARTRSILNDCLIILKTVPAVLWRTGSY